MPSSFGCYDNGSEFPASVPTFLHVLRANGYRTTASGKMHFVGPDQLHGFEQRLTGDIYPANFDWTCDWSRGPHYNHGTGIWKLTEQFGCCDGPTEEMNYDDRAQAKALRWLRETADQPQPNRFCLCVSFTHPHDPFRITREWWDLYRDRDIAPPTTPPDAPVHEFNRWINTHHGVDRHEISPSAVIHNRRAYYAMISYVDAKVGELLDELDKLGLADDTAVIFTSDHGEMLGEHGMWFKRTFYEESIAVPLIARWPGGPRGQRCPAVVSLTQLGSTILDLVDVLDDTSFEAEDWLADSLLTAIDKPDRFYRTEVEYLGEGAAGPLQVIRSDNLKFVQAMGCPPLLFDLSADPHERHDLYDSPRHADRLDAIEEDALTEADLEMIADEVILSQEQRLLIARAMRQGEPTHWDLPD
jgi:choline-sulfatase